MNIINNDYERRSLVLHHKDDIDTNIRVSGHSVSVSLFAKTLTKC